MAIHIVGDSTGTVPKGSGSSAISLPTGLQQNDLVIVSAARDIVSFHDEPISGWTQGLAVNSTFPGREIYYKFMGASPDSSIAVDAVDGEFGCVAAVICRAFRGVDLVTPFDMGLEFLFNSTGMPNPPSNTTVTPGALRLIFGFLDDDNVGVVTHPTFENVLYQASNDAADNASVMMATLLAPTAGALDPEAFVDSGGASDNSGAYHIALRPSTDTFDVDVMGAQVSVGKAIGVSGANIANVMGVTD